MIITPEDHKYLDRLDNEESDNEVFEKDPNRPINDKYDAIRLTKVDMILMLINALDHDEFQRFIKSHTIQQILKLKAFI